MPPLSVESVAVELISGCTFHGACLRRGLCARMMLDTCKEIQGEGGRLETLVFSFVFFLLQVPGCYNVIY